MTTDEHEAYIRNLEQKSESAMAGLRATKRLNKMLALIVSSLVLLYALLCCL